MLYAVDADPASLAARGRDYLNAGRISDALDFFEQTPDREGLEAVLRIARETADYFLFDRCARALSLTLEPGEWEELGARADGLGKALYGYRFRLRAGLPVEPPVPEPVTPLPRGVSPPASSLLEGEPLDTSNADSSAR